MEVMMFVMVDYTPNDVRNRHGNDDRKLGHPGVRKPEDAPQTD